MRRATTLVLLLAALPSVAAWGATGAPDAASVCEGFAERPGIGPSCPVEGGFEVVWPDGHRSVTHGADPVPGHLHGHVFPAAPRPPVCVDDPLLDRHAHVIYARPPTRADRGQEVVDEVRHMVALANGLLHKEASLLGAPSLDYRMRCDADGQVQVDAIVLPFREGGTPTVTEEVPSSTVDFYRIVAAVRAMGYDNPHAKYWIWYDDPFACRCAGVADGPLDGQRTPSNQANGGPHYAITFGYEGGEGAFTLMHESGHTMGAVHFQAPHSSGAGHCNDGMDVMCYADGGPTSAYTRWKCTDRIHFDCGHDTYFHPRPAATTYIATKWNLGAPLNRFVQGCLYAEATVVPAAAGTGLNELHIEVPAACQGARFAAMGEHSLPGTELVTYTSPQIVVGNNVNVCWLAADGAVLRCDAARIHEEGVVPMGASRAVVTHASGFHGRILLSII